MKDHLMSVKQEEGVESYINKIRNTIAGCREKWKKMPKVQYHSSFNKRGFLKKIKIRR